MTKQRMGYLFEFNGRFYAPEGVVPREVQPADVAEHNRRVEEAEIEWLKTAPPRCALYISAANQVTTFLGTVVGQATIVRSGFKDSFGRHAQCHPVSTAIYGVRYVGRWYPVAGTLVRLRKANIQPQPPKENR